MFKKNIYISLLIIPNFVFGFDLGRAALNFAGEAAESMIKTVQRINEERAISLKCKEQDLRRTINSIWSTQAEKETAQRQLDLLMKQQDDAQAQAAKLEEQVAQLGVDTIKMGTNILGEMATADIRKKQAVEVAAVEAKIKGDADRNMLRDKLNFLQNRKNMLTLGIGAMAISGGFFGMKYGAQLTSDLLKHYFRNPTLSTDTSLLSFSEKVQNLVLGVKKPEANLSDVVLEAKLSQQIHDIALSVKESVVNGFNLPNILFYGPAGTGKTMMAKTMARWSGLEYIYFAASDLDKFSAEEGLIKLSELFEFAKKSNNKLMIVIDEAELLFHKRDGSLSEKTQKLLTHILTYTGTETPDYMMVLMTNLPDKLDDAVLSRINYKIKIDVPALEQRAGIITKYVNDYLVKKPNITESKLAQFINKLRKKKTIVPITVEKDALSSDAIMEIARKTEGFVGRDLEKMISEMRALASVKPNKVLTAVMINDIVTNKIEQNNQILHRQIK